MRYIELNPVRAGMVQDPSQYRWSSYRHNGLGQPDPRITPHPLYLAIERNDTDRQTAYRALFRSELDEEALGDIRLALSQGQPLGHGRFSDRIYAAAGVRRTQKRPGRPEGRSNQSDDTETQTGFGFRTVVGEINDGEKKTMRS